MTVRRDSLGRFAPCCEHGDAGRNARGQCGTCQREAKERYEVAHRVDRAIAAMLERGRVAEAALSPEDREFVDAMMGSVGEFAASLVGDGR